MEDYHKCVRPKIHQDQHCILGSKQSGVLYKTSFHNVTHRTHPHLCTQATANIHLLLMCEPLKRSAAYLLLIILVLVCISTYYYYYIDLGFVNCMPILTPLYSTI